MTHKKQNNGLAVCRITAQIYGLGAFTPVSRKLKANTLLNYNHSNNRKYNDILDTTAVVS